MVLFGYRVWPLLKKTGKEILDDDVFSLAAATAYNFFFSLFPLFLFAAPLIGLIGNPHRTVDWIMQQLAQVVPTEALNLVQGVVRSVVFAPDAPGIVSIGAVLTLWAAGNVFRTLMDALDRAYNVTETRPFWKRALMSMAAVIVTGILIFVASTIMLAGPEIVSWLGRALGFSRAWVWLWTVLQYPIAFALVVLTFGLTYYFLPNMRQSKRQVLVAAIVASVLWIGVTLLFRLYVVHFGSYNKTYGTIGAVIILLTWMYLTMLVVLAGGELASELHHGTGRIDPRRGAVYYGRVVTAGDPSRSSTDRVVRQPLSASGPEHHGDAARD